MVKLKRENRKRAELPKLTVCSVISRNYLSYARAFASSLKEQHPESRAYIVVMDGLECVTRSDRKLFEPIAFGDLAKRWPELYGLAFRYPPFELSCAVKPFLLEYIFEKLGVPHAFYFDTDIMLYARLDGLIRSFDSASILLTPHLVTNVSISPNNGLLPVETNILLNGTYNMGFVGVANDKIGKAFLRWWSHRIQISCEVEPTKGYFVDQKWCDLVPGVFPRVSIVREPEYNVAHWNLHERKLEKKGKRFKAHGRDLVFYHFSGLDLKSPRLFSMFPTRHQLRSIAPLGQLYRQIRVKIKRAGWEKTARIEWGLNQFSNGIRLNRIIRNLYSNNATDFSRFENPFDASLESSFFCWMLDSPPGILPPLLLEMFRVQKRFRGEISDRSPYFYDRVMEWAIDSGCDELRMDPKFKRIFRVMWDASFYRRPSMSSANSSKMA